MKKAIIFLGVGAVLALWLEADTLKKFTPQIQTSGDLSVDKMREQNLNVVKKAVEGLRKTLPQEVDKYTRFTAIDSNGTRLIYTFEVDAGPKSNDTLRKEGTKMAPRIFLGICTSAERFLQADIDITYRYINKTDKEEILLVEVDKSKCPRKLK